jgi:hypothetical protein
MSRFYNNDETDIDLEIETLLDRHPQRDYEVPFEALHARLASLKLRQDAKDLKEYYNFDSSEDEDRQSADESDERVVVVNGEEIGDLPTEYEIRDLRQNELPVIGKFARQTPPCSIS